MNYQHKKLAEGEWQKLSFLEQMANVGSEVLRAREIFVDYFFYENTYQSSAESWKKYFNAFNYAANLNK